MVNRLGRTAFPLARRGTLWTERATVQPLTQQTPLAKHHDVMAAFLPKTFIRGVILGGALASLGSLAPARALPEPLLAVAAAQSAQQPVLPPHMAPAIKPPPLPEDQSASPEPRALDDIAEPLPDARAQAALLARAGMVAQNYAPRPALWKISDRDTTIYLFGTIHVLPPGFRWRNAIIDRAVGASDSLLVETVSEGSEGGLEALVTAAQRAPGGKGKARALPSLAQRLPAEHRPALGAFMAGLSAELAATIDRLPTWLAAVAISFIRDYRAGDIPGEGADDWLEEHFRSGGRPVAAIEDGDAVLDTVNAVPESEQRVMLVQALTAPTPPASVRHAPLHAWARGEIGKGSPLTVDFESATGSSALDEPLMRRRNAAWAGALSARMARPGTVFFAAGVAHFVGTDSLLDELKQRGLKVHRIQ